MYLSMSGLITGMLEFYDTPVMVNIININLFINEISVII